MRGFRLSATAVALCLGSFAQAEIYQCEMDGVKTFSYTGCTHPLRKNGHNWADVDKELAEKDLWKLRDSYLHAKAQIEGRCDRYAEAAETRAKTEVAKYYVTGLKEMLPDVSLGEIVSDPSVVNAIKTDPQVRGARLNALLECHSTRQQSTEKIDSQYKADLEDYIKKYGQLPDRFPSFESDTKPE